MKIEAEGRTTVIVERYNGHHVSPFFLSVTSMISLMTGTPSRPNFHTSHTVESLRLGLDAIGAATSS